MEGASEARDERCRNLLFMSRPDLWSHWPYLPLLRQSGGAVAYGVLCDWFGACGKTGYRATVFVSNLFLLPPTEAEFLALPREDYDTLDELVEAGWRVD